MIEPIILPKSETFDPSALARAVRVLAAVSSCEGGVKITLPVDRARALAHFLDGGGFMVSADKVSVAVAKITLDLDHARTALTHERICHFAAWAVLLVATLLWNGGAL